MTSVRVIVRKSGKVRRGERDGADFDGQETCEIRRRPDTPAREDDAHLAY